MKHSIRILFITVVIAFCIVTASGQTWDLAADFSNTSNPNGAWSYGTVGFSLCDSYYFDSTYDFSEWESGGFQSVSLNRSANTEFGIPPGTASLECDYISPDARWTAPSAGQFNIQIQIGGSTAPDSAGSGNANVANAGVAINGVAQSPNSFVNNIKTWTFANLSLNAGDTVDAFVSQQYGSGNTATIFTVTAVPPPTTNYSVDWFKVAGGGGTSTGGGYTVSGTFGQQDAGGPMNGGGYSVEGGFWSLYALQSSSATGTAPVITSQPQSLFVTNGASAVFSVTVSGTSPFFYQWQKNGTNLYDGGSISGSATAKLTLSNATFSAAGGYSVVIQNAYGNTNSSVAKLTLILPAYVATDLGTLGGSYSFAQGINNSGQVVGFANTSSGYTHAFLCGGGAMQDLGTLGGSTSYAYGINDSGQVAGIAETLSGYAHAFLYGGGTMQDLGTFGGTYSQAQGINNSGQVVGYARTSSGYAHAFLYGGGTMQDLGTLGGIYSQAQGINNSGQVVGFAYTTGDAAYHAFLYSGGAMQDLGTLGGTYSQAQGINNSGQVVGSAATGNAEHAFLYGGGTMNDLGTLGGSDSYAQGINNSGQIVGYSETAGNPAYHAFLYSGGAMFDLNNLLITNLPGGEYLYQANGINDSGQIAVTSANSQAYLLTPISPAAYLAGNFTPKIQTPEAGGGNFTFSWNVFNTYPAVGYQVQTTTNLAAPNWVNLGGVLPGTNATLSASDTISTNRQRFYRVLLVQ